MIFELLVHTILYLRIILKLFRPNFYKKVRKDYGMFKLTESAYHKLIEIVNQEKKSEDEQLYLRLTMGIG